MYGEPSAVKPADEAAPIPAYNSFETPESAFASRKRTDALDWARNKKVLQNVTEAIGLTPLVQLNRILVEHNIDPSIRILAKLEFFNPGGSIKDRVAQSLFSIIPKGEGTVVIEASSGNTACGLALNSAVSGVHSVFTIPNTCSLEKESILKSFGSQVIRSQSNQPWYDNRSYLGVARRVETAIRNSGGDPFYLDQYQHPRNPSAHYRGTAEEIYEQTDHDIDFVVIGAGTGGTLAGVGTRLKELSATCKVIGVEPEGSIFGSHRAKAASEQPRFFTRPDDLTKQLETRASSWKVEGIGKKYRPPNLTSGVADEWISVSDAETFAVARQIIRCEGILAGGSSGTALAACLRLAKLDENKGKTFVVIFPDGARNYISTFLDDGWLALNNFASIENAPSFSFWSNVYKGARLESVCDKTPRVDFVRLMSDDTVAEAIDGMMAKRVKHCVVLSEAEPSKILTVCSLEDLQAIPAESQLDSVNVNKCVGRDRSCRIAEALTLLCEMTRVWTLKNPAIILHEPSGSADIGILTTEGILAYNPF